MTFFCVFVRVMGSVIQALLGVFFGGREWAKGEDCRDLPNQHAILIFIGVFFSGSYITFHLWIRVFFERPRTQSYDPMSILGLHQLSSY